MKRSGLAVLMAATAISFAGVASAAPLTLTGNFLKVGISDAGTFGSNGNTSPGILHDPTGTQNFGVNDYLIPGTPHDSFSINSTESGVRLNDNFLSGGAFGSHAPTAAVVPGFSIAATWTGSNSFLQITNTYYFNPGDQIIHVKTTLTALQNLTNLAFGRSTDPDPDQITTGSFVTVNTRGNLTHASPDLVSSAGPNTGLTLGILNESGNTYEHNTGISDQFGAVGCCAGDDPYNVLAGYGPIFPATSTQDDGLQMAWRVGDLAEGQSRDILYAYVFGEHQDTVGTPSVPEPATLTVLGAALAGLGLLRRRRQA